MQKNQTKEEVNIEESIELSKEDEEPEGLLPANNSQSQTIRRGDQTKTALELKEGTSILHYEIISPIGSGGMGEVYRVRHKRLNQEFAIKLLKKKLLKDQTNKKRFKQEAKACSKLNSPHIVSIFESGITEDGTPFLVMEEVKGENLAQIINSQGTLSNKDFIEIFSQVLVALDYAHKNEILHRDLKPSNIIVSRDNDNNIQTKLVDFGISRFLQESDKPEQQLTKTGELIGSPIYMSPEQCVNASYDPRSDIYSLGVVMYESLAGQPPFLGGNAISTLMKHINENPEPIFKESLVNKNSKLLEQVVMRCLEKNPDMRYGSAQELLADLKSIDKGSDDKQQKKLRLNARRAGLRRLLSKRGKKLSLCLMASFTTISLIYHVYDNNYKAAQFNRLVNMAQSSRGLTEKNLIWREAYSIAQAMRKDSRIMGILLGEIGDTEAGSSSEHDILYNGKKGADLLIKSYKILKQSSATDLEKSVVLSSLSYKWNLDFIDNQYYLPDQERKDALIALAKAQNQFGKGHLDKAIGTLEKVYVNGASSANLEDNLANFYGIKGLETKDPLDSIAYFEKCFYLSHTASARKNAYELIQEFLAKTDLNPESPNTRIKLAQKALDRGDRQAAIFELTCALAIKKDTATMDRLALLQNQERQSKYRYKDRALTKAIPYSIKLIELYERQYGKNSEISTSEKLQLAKMYMKTGNYNKAIEHFEPLMETWSNSKEYTSSSPETAESYSLYLRCLYEAGHFEKATAKTLQFVKCAKPSKNVFLEELKANISHLEYNYHYLQNREEIEIAYDIPSINTGSQRQIISSPIETALHF